MGSPRALILLILIALVGCASYKRPESIESKMGRLRSKKIPAIPRPSIEVPSLSHALPKNRAPQKGRAPLPNYSNKHLYFLTLYGQYRQFARYTENPRAHPEISLCPSFHSTLLDYKKAQGHPPSQRAYRLSHKSARLRDADYRAHHPELYLPLGSTTVLETLKQDSGEDTRALVTRAVEGHTRHIRRELEELCEHGHSEHYYAYENLITKAESENLPGANARGLAILLKTTLFTNVFLLESLKSSSRKVGRSLASTEAETDSTQRTHRALMERFKAGWVQAPLEALKNKK